MTIQEAIKEIEKKCGIGSRYISAEKFDARYAEIMGILLRHAEEDNEKMRQIITSPEGMKMAHEVFLACLREMSKKDMTCATCSHYMGECCMMIGWHSAGKEIRQKPSDYCSRWEALP